MNLSKMKVSHLNKIVDALQMFSTDNTTKEGEICDTLFCFDLQINLRTGKKHQLILHGVSSAFISSVLFWFHSSCLHL